MKTQLFINKFAKGSNENSNLGTGAMVGIDTYTKKDIAMLAKKSILLTGGVFTAEPHFIETSGGGAYIWVQLGDGNVVYSTDGGNNFIDSAFPATGAQHGNGLIYFQNYIFAFTDTKIYWHAADPTSGGWTDWTTTKALGSLQNFATNPIAGLHFPFLFPNNRGVYFGNGGAGLTANATAADCTIGFFGQVGTTLFDPAGAINVNFLWNNGILALPSYTYNIGSIDFLPPSQLAITAVAFNNPSQGSDLITWDTVSANKFSPPLRIYSNSFASSVATAGIKQIYNRNQVLYAVTGGNHTIYETNGSSFNLVEDIGLYSVVRSSAGAETDTPVYFNSYPQAICVVGNKLLTGVSTITGTSTYPVIASTGIFPMGIWSIAFNNQGGHSTQCEFTLPIPIGGTLTSPGGTGNYFKITCIRPIPQVGSSSNQIAAGFSFNDSATGNTNLFGLALVDLYNYISDSNFTSIESELFEIGTPLVPQTVNLIEVNLAKKLLTGQSILLSYRTSLTDTWTALDTYTGDGTKNYYHTDSNPIDATQFIQLRVRMATGAGGNNPTYSPQLRTVILS